MFDANIFAKHLLALPKGHRVKDLISRHGHKPEQFFSELHAAIEFVVPGMQPSTRYSTKDLVGPDLWARYSIGVARAAGICVAFMVARGDLPLSSVTAEGVYPRRYRLKDGVNP